MPKAWYVNPFWRFCFSLLMDMLDDLLGQQVIETIIPAISILRERHRVAFATLLNQEILFSKGVCPEIEISDLVRSDEFFDVITFKYVLDTPLI